MIERGTVTAIDGTWVTVRLEIQEGCSSCASGGLCAAGKNLVRALDRSGLKPGIGERVGVEVSGSEQARGMLLMLALPLTLFAAGYAAGRALWPEAGEGPAALLGLGGIAAGIAVGAYFEKRRKDDVMPRIVPLEA